MDTKGYHDEINDNASSGIPFVAPTTMAILDRHEIS